MMYHRASLDEALGKEQHILNVHSHVCLHRASQKLVELPATSIPLEVVHIRKPLENTVFKISFKGTVAPD
jgi:hypothetical protein